MLRDQARTENLLENVHILSRLVACSWVRNVSCLKQGAGRAGRSAGTSQTPNCSGRRASRYNLVCLATTGWYPASCITVLLIPELPLQTSQNFWFLRTSKKLLYSDDLRRHTFRNYKTDILHTENVKLCCCQSN